MYNFETSRELKGTMNIPIIHKKNKINKNKKKSNKGMVNKKYK